MRSEGSDYAVFGLGGRSEENRHCPGAAQGFPHAL